MKQIGKRLQELRESKGLSQSDLANYLGISQPLLSQIESGNRNLNLSLLDKLCALYGCSDSYIRIILNMQFLNELNERK